jgi:hypothetical protein
MDRLPLRAGRSTPEFVEETLSVFGNNPHGEPLYRLIWSERKDIYFAGEIAPEYGYLTPPCWVLEVWVDPLKDAGPEREWRGIKEALMGPYPRKGTYNYAQQFPQDWEPTEHAVRLLAVGLRESKHIPIKQREGAIRENLEAKAAAERGKVAEAIVDLQDSASLNKMQQPVSGRKNTFRTVDDHVRDRDRFTKTFDHLPKQGGKLLN